MASISIIGLSDTNANGTYVSKGYHDGQLFYEGPNGYLIIYYTSNMPFCNDSGYFLVSVASYYGSVPLYNYKYLTKSINPVTGAWSSLMSTISGEDNLNNLLFDYVSSSSSSSSFSSDSSSSKSSISSNSSSSSSKSSASSFSSLSTLSSYSSEL